MVRSEIARKEVGLTGRMTVLSTCFGGWLLGGLIPLLESRALEMSPHDLWWDGTIRFLWGAGLGFLHGWVLGILGRDEEFDALRALAIAGTSVLYTLPALAVAWPLAGWTSMLPSLLERGSMLHVLGIAVAVSGSVILLWLWLRTGWSAFQRAYRRWPERRIGTALFFLTFLCFLAELTQGRVELWGWPWRVPDATAILFLFASFLWLVGPLLTLALRLRDGGRPHLLPTGSKQIALSAVATLGLVALLAWLRRPLYLEAPFLPLPAHELGDGAAIARGLGSALLDGILVRLLILLVVIRMLAPLRYAAALGVVVAAALESLLHLPGLIDAGVDSSLMTMVLIRGVFVPGLLLNGFVMMAGWIPAVLAQWFTVGAIVWILGGS